MAHNYLKFQFQNDNGITLSAALDWPEQPKAYALFAHCFACSKDVLAEARISRDLNERGIAVMRFDFTGLGHSQGDFSDTTFSTNVSDLVAAARYLEQHYEAPRLLIGHSLGGAAALCAAAQIPSVHAVVTLGTPSDVSHVLDHFKGSLTDIENTGSCEVQLGQKHFMLKQQFVQDAKAAHLLQHVSELNKPLLIMHSPVDNIVSIDHAAKIFTAAKHPKSFISLDTADHLILDPKDADYVSEVIASWCSRYLA